MLLESWFKVPKVIQCSYKAISDDKFKFFNVSLLPLSKSLPVFMVNEENYSLFEAGGGLSEMAEECWSIGSTVGGRNVAEAATTEKEEFAPEVTDLPPKDQGRETSEASVLGVGLHARIRWRRSWSAKEREKAL